MAAVVLDEIGEECVASYTMFERNAQLAEQSREKTAGKSFPVRNVEIDACSCEGIAAISNLESLDLWIASGSTLCGQVGEWHNSEETISAMATSLKNGGFMIITGFTQSFLHPRLLHKLHLRVLQGSLPSNEATKAHSFLRASLSWMA